MSTHQPVPVFDLRADGRPDTDTIYTRCPTCGLVGAPGFIEYGLTGPTGGMDLQQPVQISCVAGAHHYTAHVSDFIPRDAVRTCARAACGHTFPAPAVADQAICPHCHLHQVGPFLPIDDTRTAYVDDVTAIYLAEVRARLLRRREGDPS